MFPAMMNAYPWDLLDEGVDDVLDRLQGELGITGISVWTACGPSLRYRAREVEPRIFRTRGGLFFQPDEAQYSATRLKPQVADGYRGRNALRKIADACNNRSMALRAIVSAADAGPTAHRHPESACKNALGAASEQSVCLVNPDVQAYLCGVTADLSRNYGVAGVVIADFFIAWLEAYSPALLSFEPLDATQRLLLALCFCESCRQHAASGGMDATMVRRAVCALLRRNPSGSSAGDKESRNTAEAEAQVACWAGLQTTAGSALWTRLREACACELIYDGGTSVSDAVLPLGPPCSDRRFRSILQGAPPANVDRLPWAGPAAIIYHVNRPQGIVDAACHEAARTEVCFSTAFLLSPAIGEFVSSAGQTAERGLGALHFDHYGALPESSFSSIKQAIRLARRLKSDA